MTPIIITETGKYTFTAREAICHTNIQMTAIAGNNAILTRFSVTRLTVKKQTK